MRVSYGFELQGEKLAVVRAARSGGRLDFSSVSPGEPVMTREIRQGAVTVGCLTTRESFTRWTEAPFDNVRKAARVLPTLLDIELPFALEDCVYDFLAVRRTGRKAVRALAVAALTEAVRKKLALLAGFGLDPMILDQEGLALWTQSLAELPRASKQTGEVRVVVYLGGDRSSVVVGRDSGFIAAHGVRAGDARQIGRLLRSSLGETVETARWIWAGPGAGDMAAVTALQDRLRTEWPGTSEVHKEPAAFLPRALAARGLSAGPLRCNLRMGVLAHPLAAARIRSRSRHAALVLLVGGLLLCGISLAARSNFVRTKAAAERTFRSRVERLAGRDIGSAKGEHAVRILDEIIARRKAELRPFLEAFDPLLIADLVSVMEIGKDGGLQFDALTLSGKELRIRGSARDWRSCDGLMKYWKTRGIPAALDRKDARPDGRIPFEILSGGARE